VLLLRDGNLWVHGEVGRHDFAELSRVPGGGVFTASLTSSGNLFVEIELT
jgi:hypothetical protein